MSKYTKEELREVDDVLLNNYDEIKLSEDYWDCECVHDYIHPNTRDVCDKCKALREDQPSSRLDEVEDLFKKRKTNDSRP